MDRSDTRNTIPASPRLGLRVQTRRRELGYRFAKDFAAALGWNASMVSRVENGERGLTDRDIEQLCRHLRVTREWLQHDGDVGPDQSIAGAADLIERVVALRREEAALLEQAVDLLRRAAP